MIYERTMMPKQLSDLTAQAINNIGEGYLKNRKDSESEAKRKYGLLKGIVTTLTTNHSALHDAIATELVAYQGTNEYPLTEPSTDALALAHAAFIIKSYAQLTSCKSPLAIQLLNLFAQHFNVTIDTLTRSCNTGRKLLTPGSIAFNLEMTLQNYCKKHNLTMAPTMSPVALTVFKTS